MEKINMHGLEMVGLKKTSGETEDYGAYSPNYNEIFYNLETGEVWAKFATSLGQNSWTEYDDKAIIKICNTSRHMTMQEIADAIAESVEQISAAKEGRI